MVSGTEMELVIIRPPLVYAGNAPGNFKRLLNLVSMGIPLPFKSVSNKRSMISLGNLADFIRVCVVHPAAANELFLISDGIDVSLPDLLNKLGE
ncbi:MAG: NAD-dependent epimerase, partial [Acinetobacter sp.]